VYVLYIHFFAILILRNIVQLTTLFSSTSLLISCCGWF